MIIERLYAAWTCARAYCDKIIDNKFIITKFYEKNDLSNFFNATAEQLTSYVHFHKIHTNFPHNKVISAHPCFKQTMENSSFSWLSHIMLHSLGFISTKNSAELHPIKLSLLFFSFCLYSFNQIYRKYALILWTIMISIKRNEENVGF